MKPGNPGLPRFARNDDTGRAGLAMTNPLAVIARSVSDVAIHEAQAPGLPRFARNDDTGRASQ
jgi:hypothetical protein